MADRPILFSAPMVLALLDGSKTQTRRILNPQPTSHVWRYGWSSQYGATWHDDTGGGRIPIWAGYRLWVRETLKADSNDHGSRWITYAADGAVTPHGLVRWDWKRDSIPSIHMPRWASRLTLTVTDVRVERLQDISEEDAEAEGIEWNPRLDPVGSCKWRDYSRESGGIWPPSASYATLWNHINGQGAWEKNPWVVAYSFTVEKQNIDLIERAA